jgi:hypothetical protein
MVLGVLSGFIETLPFCNLSSEPWTDGLFVFFLGALRI